MVKGEYNDSLKFDLNETASVRGFLYGELATTYTLYLENSASHLPTWKPDETYFSSAALEAPNAPLFSLMIIDLGIKGYPTQPARFSMKLKCQYKVRE